MPSKRKKNKRRMRRVQAQRRALEDQHAANPPIKASSGIAISAPPTATPKKAAKISPPTREKPPQAIPISAPAVEPPKFEPQPVVKEEAAEAFVVEVAAAGGVLLEQATVDVKSRVGDEVEGPARVAKEAPAESIPPAEPSTVEADLAKEAEVPVSEAEPVSEVTAPDEASVVAAVEAETEANEDTQTEMSQTQDVCEADSQKDVTLAEEDTETKEELEVSVAEEVTVSESVKEQAEEPEVEDLTSDQSPAEVELAAEKTESDTGSEVEVVIETLDPAEPPEDGEEKLEDSAALGVQPVAAIEDAVGSPVEIPAVLNTITEAPLGEAEPPVVEHAEGTADLLLQKLAATESVSTAKDVSTSPVVQQEAEGTGDAFITQSESTDATPVDPETVSAAPAGEIAAANQKCLGVLTDEAKSGGCDVPCQGPLPVEAVQLGGVELSVEITQNGNIVPEVSIEG
ncbi:fibrous sheath CABYR-binding protein-like [Poecilia reticulata]|uniref:fibrous sheath CABYR-binding protein-like n=1 Tax=Poecilia reticulata TaxID=8081 RepID=UPI0004A4D881|nr:PREDICTED: fibrous sheath CABYR-binding protein-like [Poecilia reticulata]XP_017162284.1 PREDICTED: fibrous sheath CABYR-binding protein-like [Poecilia reticulata]